MNKLDDFLRFHETALSVRGQRQQLLASNIANADTPNYKARDIDFSKAMSAAIEKTTPSNALKKTDGTHLDAKGTIAGVVPGYRQESQGNVDGNTVNIDEERNAFTDNALRYEASLTMINMQIKGILAAIQG